MVSTHTKTYDVNSRHNYYTTCIPNKSEANKLRYIIRPKDPPLDSFSNLKKSIFTALIRQVFQFESQ